MTIRPNNGQLFASWGSSRAARPTPARQTGAAESALQTLLTGLASDLGAEGAVMTQRVPDNQAPTPIFSEMRVANENGKFDVATIVDSLWAVGSREVGWSHLIIANDPFCVLTLAFPVGGAHFEVTAIFRHVDQQAQRRIDRKVKPMVPLLTGLFSLWADGQRLRLRADGLACALDRSDVGVILLDVDGDILFTNRFAETLIEADDGIRRCGRSLAAHGLADSLRLKVAIDHVLDATANGLDRARAPVLTLTRGSRRGLIASVMAPAQASNGDVGAIMFLFDPEQDLKPLIRTACKFYALSPVEITLTCLLVSGTNLSEAAVTMRIKAQTARSYLKQIFLKTDTNRQADLTRLIMSSIVRIACPIDLEVV